ncbi:MAG: sigma-70 family RNA polymerase sigma factor [Acutalibacteraceae bacterium]|jgi:RNA polymerase sporulation-specific sigma factor
MVKSPQKRDEFIKENLKLVHSICKRFVGKGIDYEDLYQTGCIGLVKAYDNFDRERGLCFSTYAVPVIMGEIRRLFRDGGSIKVSRSIKELGIKIAKEKNKFEQKHCRQPTVSELAEMLNVTPEEITEASLAAQSTVSLTYEGEDGICECDLPTVSTEDEISDKLNLSEAFKQLDPTEQKIINYRYFNFFTQSKTAALLNMTQVQVSRAEKKILMKLREILK